MNVSQLIYLFMSCFAY